VKMVGGFSLLSSPVIDSSHACPCICLDPMNCSSMNLKSGMGKKQLRSREIGSLELSSSFVDSGKEFLGIVNKRSSRKQKKVRSPLIVNELGGQYEESFEDVKTVTIYIYGFLIVNAYVESNLIIDISW
jgi:hypothetical protein